MSRQNPCQTFALACEGPRIIDIVVTHSLRRKRGYQAKTVLLATGIFHIPPDINGVRSCLGHTMFFCKDCDGARVLGKPIAIYGANDETADYALGMLLYSSTALPLKGSTLRAA